MPQTDADAKAHSAELVKQFPSDPRAHLMRALALMDARDDNAAEAEMRTALAANAALPGMFTADLDYRLRTVLALILQHNDKPDDARREAGAVCASQAADRDNLEKAGLCP